MFTRMEIGRIAGIPIYLDMMFVLVLLFFTYPYFTSGNTQDMSSGFVVIVGILVSILLLGGIGNPWGLMVATIIVVVVPEKLQTIQEYRFLLYALMVIAVLLFRPEGLLPRPVRRYFPGWRP